MADIAQNPHTLRVFVASPSDVAEEREALKSLVRNINDVLTYLDPGRNLHIELVGYENDSYPDFGSPQEVINRQIPVDYEIFLGIMWKRCGTPTATAPSGTIEEYRRACERRKAASLPRIMFYFCDEAIALPSLEDLPQLSEVLKFRHEVNEIGLTSSYPTHAEFAEHVRGGLLRAIRDILQNERLGVSAENLVESSKPSSEILSESVISPARAILLALAKEYESARASMVAGSERTRQMTAVVGKMKAAAPDGQDLVEEFIQSSSAGIRLAAVAILQMFPKESYLDWLATRLDNPDVEAPFVGFQAAVALAEAVRALPRDDCSNMKAALSKAKELAEKLPTDSPRLTILETAQLELIRKCS